MSATRARSVPAGLLCAALVAAAAHAAPRPMPARVVEAFGPARGMFARGAQDSAYAALESLAARALAARDDTLRVAAQFELGARRAWFGNMAQAIPCLEDARTRAWALRDSTRWVQSSQWLAYALNNAGRLAEGEPIARRALPAAVALGERRAESYLRLSLAYPALLAGRALEARRGYRRALPLFESQQDAYGVCEALQGLGRTYTVTGERDSAHACFRRAADRAEAARLPRSAASAYNNLATHEFLEGDPDAATESWRQAARTMRATGELAGTITATGNLCLALTQLDRDEEARAIADSLLDFARKQGFAQGVSQVEARLAQIDLNSSRLLAAARRFRAALAGDPDQPLESRVECTTGLIQSLVPLDSAAVALALYDQLAPLAEARVAPPRAAEFNGAGALAAFRCGQLARADALARRSLAAAKRAGFTQQELVAERLLARILAATGRQADARVHLANADQAWRRRRDQATGLEWRTMLTNSATLGTAWAEVELGRGVERRRARIAPALAALERIRSTLLLELAGGPGGRHVTMPPATLDQLQRSVLAPGELLLVAWTGNERGWLVAVARDTAVSVPLPYDTALERDVDLLREAIAADPPLEAAALDGMLAEAGRRLLEPLLPLLRRHRRVVIVPSGPLQRMPFEALRLPLGRGGALAPFGATHAVSRAPSASLLALGRTRSRAAPAAGPALLAVANTRGPNGRMLPQALAEVRALDARYKGVRLLEAPRDAAAVLRAMAGAGAIHVAAHAGFDPVSPWRSTLQLADGAPVRARDVLEVTARPGLVVLSACETVGGSIRGTGGMEGLSAAFLCAGARGVVATLWPVEDRAARRFVEAFYEESERAPDAATALARARARFQAGGSGSQVRDWAAFTLVGDPGARVRLARKRLPLPGF